MSSLYRFTKPGYRRRQSTKLARPGVRRAFLLDCNFLNDAKIATLNRMGDFTLLPLLLHIWGQLDLVSESWEERADIFDTWARGAFGMTNRFKVQERLQKLHDLGLISFEVIPHLGSSYPLVNPQLRSSYTLTNPQIPPLEPPQTQSGSDAVVPQIRKEKQEKKTQPNLPPNGELPHVKYLPPRGEEN